MRFPRASGILLHPTSLPESPGIGDLGPTAYRFVEFLASAGQRYWQVLPLGPTGYGDSPYQCFSAFAGNPLLVSPEQLITNGLLPSEALRDIPAFPDARVDYGRVIAWKMPLLERSFAYFQAHGSGEQKTRFEAFCQTQAHWLDDFSLFMALKAHFGGTCWDAWPVAIRMHQPSAVTEWSNRLIRTIQLQRYVQWLFFEQWQGLREYAHARGVRMIGDLPIFVAYDSADVWANPELFYLDAQGHPTVVAGVPPDYFSPTGQLWGNPLYRWDVMAQRGYTWWVDRFRSIFQVVDVVRIDHFRGFQAYWEVPAGEETAVNGRWVDGPGKALFLAVRSALGDLPIIAEDLGLITPEVEALRDHLGFPGMRVLQFAFGGQADHPYLPHNHIPHCVVYTGTHDNDTTVGWYHSAPPEVQDHVRRYLARDGRDIAWDFIRAAMSSVADTAVVPMQDVLALGSEARMNTPGQAANNWTWRFRWEQLQPWERDNLAEMAYLYGRVLTVEDDTDSSDGEANA
ncbi:MAG: 4-alpha-glucanotransferase [Anaerolineae bacterium]|nr:4-alpha-glucanotransferase [Anaerolineae bacterium]